jgi:hypothetical protein
VVYNNDPFSIFTGLVDASGGPVFLNKVSFDMGVSWTYGPLATELAAAADVRLGASNLGVPGTYDPITGNYTDPGGSHVQAGTWYKFAGETINGSYGGGVYRRHARLVGV